MRLTTATSRIGGGQVSPARFFGSFVYCTVQVYELVFSVPEPVNTSVPASILLKHLLPRFRLFRKAKTSRFVTALVELGRTNECT